LLQHPFGLLNACDPISAAKVVSKRHTNGLPSGAGAAGYAMKADMFREDPACIYRLPAPVSVRLSSLQTLPEEGATVEEP
jgi:hypothetical protein